jgi:hypothetical protein
LPAQVLSWHIQQLGVSYVVVGFGMGIMQQAVILEEAEVAPTHLRGLFTSLQNFGFQAGVRRAAPPMLHLVHCAVCIIALAAAAGFALVAGLFRYKPLAELSYGWRLIFTGESCCCRVALLDASALL